MLRTRLCTVYRCEIATVDRKQKPASVVRPPNIISSIFFALSIALAAIGCSTAPVYYPGGWDAGTLRTMPTGGSDNRQSAALEVAVGSGFNEGEQNVVTELSWATSTRSGDYRFAFEGFGYTGLYRAVDETSPLGYSGGGGLFEMSKIHQVRDLGLGGGAAFGLMTEFGPYNDRLFSELGPVIYPLFLVNLFVEATFGSDRIILLHLSFGIPGLFTLGTSYLSETWGISLGVGQSWHPATSDRVEIGRVSAGVSYAL